MAICIEYIHVKQLENDDSQLTTETTTHIFIFLFYNYTRNV